ncbi:hypothetical protein FOL46_009062 [Perkinsus olseni]|uniref:Hemerythrin-like domain-containing protein n=1 Tax=Perkinsus olseni TaxID=32597 RepID=A0A7J6L457_PEROL|nr:hypothetical protein FOL46_009062 [Perkinsus olseni]
MGNYLWSPKKVASKDYFEEFIFGQNGVHHVIKRSFTIAASKKVAPAEAESFKQFVDLSAKFLLVHHLQEDEHIFPFYRKHLKDATALEGEVDEHEEVSRLLVDLEENLKQDKISDAQKICAAIRDMMCDNVNGHLVREEKILTPEAFREHATEKEVRDLSTAIHGMIKDHMNKMDSLIFMIYNMNDAEKAFFDERMPWIMTYLIFPIAANKKPEVPAAATDGSPTTSSLRSSYSDDTSSCSFFSSSSSSSSSSSDSGIPEWGEVPLVVPSPAAGSDGLCRIGDSEFSGLRGSSRTTSLLAWPAAEGKLKSSVELSSLRLHRGAISVSNGQKLILRDCGMDECRVSVGDGAELVLERCKWTSGLRPAVHVCWSTAPVDTPPRIEINDCHFSDMHVAVSLELEAFPSTDGVQQRTIPPDSVPTVGLHHCTFTDIRGAAIVVAVHIRSPLAADQTDSSDKDSVYHFNLSTLMVADESSLSYERCPARFEVSFGGSKLLRPFSFSSWPPPSGEYLTPRRGSSGRGAQQVKVGLATPHAHLGVLIRRWYQQIARG